MYEMEFLCFSVLEDVDIPIHTVLMSVTMAKTLVNEQATGQRKRLSVSQESMLSNGIPQSMKIWYTARIYANILTNRNTVKIV